MVIKNLKKATNRILKAIKSKEKIILYGDADLDGVTSVIILKETINGLGGFVSNIYFPDREIEGYGITKIALARLKKFSPALLIAMDCGIGNFQEIKLANEMGFEVMLIEHHKVLDKLPPAKIIVNPKQKGDKYPFKEMANVGITFKLSEALLEEKMSKSLRKSFLELVALATIADMMPQVDENRIFIEEGLKNLENSWRPGIKAFFASNFLKDYNLREKVSQIISILNVRDVGNNLPVSFGLLTTSSFKEAKDLIPKLREKTKERRRKIRQLLEEAERRVSGNLEPIIFEGGSEWDFHIISPIASILCKNYQKPTFVFKELEKESQGTVRVPLGIDSVSLMKKCKQYLITYGGHAPASGFRIKNENLEKFKKCLIKKL